MKKILLKRFKTKQENKIELMQLLMKYDTKLGLKGSKDIMDLMLHNNIPINLELEDDKIDELIKELEKLGLEFEII